MSVDDLDPEVDAAPRVGLDVAYPIDFGLRDEDAALWTEVVRDVWVDRPPIVVDVGCGDGRIERLVHASPFVRACWIGLDPSQPMLDRAGPLLDERVVGCAEDASSWSMVRECATRLGGPGLVPGLVDAVVIAYSTLFLVPHDRQIDVLRHAAGLVRPCGIVAVEVFIPHETTSSHAIHYRAVRGPAGDPPWLRETILDVDAATRTTRATRVYGPTRRGGHGVEPRFVVEETIYWREPAAMSALAHDAGLNGSTFWTSSTHRCVPPGSIVLVARG